MCSREGSTWWSNYQGAMLEPSENRVRTYGFLLLVLYLSDNAYRGHFPQFQNIDSSIILPVTNHHIMYKLVVSAKQFFHVAWSKGLKMRSLRKVTISPRLTCRKNHFNQPAGECNIPRYLWDSLIFQLVCTEDTSTPKGEEKFSL